MFKVEITGSSKIGECRVWTETLDRQDGSVIVRFKVYNTCFNLMIDIKYNHEHVADSPYTIAGKECCKFIVLLLT